MEKRVNFYPSQEVPASELAAMQQFGQDSLDRIVRELLFDEGRYVGLAVTKTGPLDIAIGSGTFARSGAIFRKAVTTTENLTSLLPSSGLRKVLVLVSGQEVDTEVQNRKFLINAATRSAQPKPVATRKVREAVIDLAAGPSSNSPSRPAVSAGWIVVAELTLGTTGITVDPVMEAATKALSLESAVNAITLLQAQDRKFSSMFETLRSEIAGLASELSDKAENRRVSHLVSDVLNIRNRLDMADTGTSFGSDWFSNDEESDEAFPGYTARVEGGAMQMGEVGSAGKLIKLLNPTDSKLDISESGLIMPSSSSVLRLECDEYDSDVSIASYAVSTTVGKKLQLSRTYKFYATKAGRSFAEEFLKENPKVRVRNPSTGDWQTIDLTDKKWKIDQLGGSKLGWWLKITEAYWDVDTVDVTTTGSRIAQTFLCAQAGWHRRLDLWFTDVGATGDVHIKICALGSDGDPDLKQIVGSVTLPVASIKKRAWTTVSPDPFWLDRGKRYAIVLTTTGAHVVGCAVSNGLSNGTLVASTDGVTWQVDLAKDMMFRLFASKFHASKVTVDIEDISLSGGIREIQTILTGHQPAGTDLVVQARINGVWRNLSDDDETVLAGLPNLVPLRLVFLGTLDMMPGIDLSKSRVIATRPRTSSVHVSTTRTLAGTTSAINVTQVSYDFDEARHDWGCTILHGAGFATEVNAASVKDFRRPDGGVDRKWKFTVPNIDEYRIKTTLGATSLDDAHSVTYRRDEAI